MERGGRIARGARILAVVALLAIVVPAAHKAYVGVPVMVDGREVTAVRGSCVGDLVDGDALPDGRLLAVVSHRVISATSGTPAAVLVNGVATPLTATVHAGDRIVTTKGADVVEPLIEETRTVEPTPRTIGAGSVPKVVSTGTPSVVVVTVGEISGEVVSTETVTPGEPAVVRMIPAAGANVVALTFDDGPWPGQTETVLAILAERNVPATFFMLGMRVERAPELARQVAAAGHAIGNHTYWHVNLGAVTPEVAQWEIEGTNQIIQAVTGVRPVWLRAPGGQLRGPAQAYIAQYGMRSALWTVDPQDWHDGMPPDQLAWSVIAAAHPGAIIVLHDGGGNQASTIAALPLIIDGLRAYGYEFVTLDELPVVRSDW